MPRMDSCYNTYIGKQGEYFDQDGKKTRKTLTAIAKRCTREHIIETRTTRYKSAVANGAERDRGFVNITTSNNPISSGCRWAGEGSNCNETNLGGK